MVYYFSISINGSFLKIGFIFLSKRPVTLTNITNIIQIYILFEVGDLFLDSDLGSIWPPSPNIKDDRSFFDSVLLKWKSSNFCCYQTSKNFELSLLTILIFWSEIIGSRVFFTLVSFSNMMLPHPLSKLYMPLSPAEARPVKVFNPSETIFT